MLRIISIGTKFAFLPCVISVCLLPPPVEAADLEVKEESKPVSVGLPFRRYFHEHNNGFECNFELTGEKGTLTVSGPRKVDKITKLVFVRRSTVDGYEGWVYRAKEGNTLINYWYFFPQSSYKKSPAGDPLYRVYISKTIDNPNGTKVWRLPDNDPDTYAFETKPPADLGLTDDGTEGKEGRLRALFLVDDYDKNVGKAGMSDWVSMHELVQNNLAPKRRSPVMVLLRSKGEFTEATIMKAIGSMKVQEEKDSLLFYYTGHGFYDKEKKEQHIVIDLKQIGDSAGSLGHKQIAAALNSKKAKFTLAISDACASFSTAPVKAPSERTMVYGNRGGSTFEQLMFNQSGFLYFNSAEIGTTASCINRYPGGGGGSACTRAFYQVATATYEQPVTWKELYPKFRTETNRIYQQIDHGEQQTQYPGLIYNTVFK